MSECESIGCDEDSEKVVYYEKLGWNGSEREYCSNHARQELEKHDDAEIVTDAY